VRSPRPCRTVLQPLLDSRGVGYTAAQRVLSRDQLLGLSRLHDDEV